MMNDLRSVLGTPAPPTKPTSADFLDGAYFVVSAFVDLPL
jgi:hypothetical protein